MGGYKKHKTQAELKNYNLQAYVTYRVMGCGDYKQHKIQIKLGHQWGGPVVFFYLWGDGVM